MLKKLILIITLIVTTIPLYSCGEDTRDWPRISLPFERENIYKVQVLHEKNNVEEVFDTTKREDLDELYEVGFVYKEKTESKNNLEKYYIKLEFTYYLKDYSIDQYKLTFYNKGITNGYVSFNDEEIHFFPADIESFYIYSIKDIGGNK